MLQRPQRSYAFLFPHSGFWILSYMAILLLGFSSPGWGGVVVFDRVTLMEEAVYLKILTKGRFFAEGGILVDIYVDDKKIKRILTGGDGYGYLKYKPERRGLIRLQARSHQGSGNGLLLVPDKKDQIIFIETESAFKDALFSEKLLGASRKATESLSRKYTLIYISRYVGVEWTRNWLAKEHFPQAVILKWQGPEMFSSLKAKGLRLYAFIGSGALASAAAEYIENRYVFEETPDGQSVKSWEEITESLKNENAGAQAEF